MTANTVTHNPWISSTPIALHITADDIEQRRDALRDWSRTTGKQLPLPMEWIIRFELAGFVVDLDTGARSRPAPVPTPTAAGIAAARPWTAPKDGAK